jgi:hypothetical protein
LSLCGTNRASELIAPAIKEGVYGVPPSMLNQAYCLIDNMINHDSGDIMQQLTVKIPGLPQNNRNMSDRKHRGLEPMPGI